MELTDYLGTQILLDSRLEWIGGTGETSRYPLTLKRLSTYLDTIISKPSDTLKDTCSKCLWNRNSPLNSAVCMRDYFSSALSTYYSRLLLAWQQYFCASLVHECISAPPDLCSKLLKWGQNIQLLQIKHISYHFRASLKQYDLEHGCANHATEGKCFCPPSAAVT